ncbi:beta-glucuronidase [Companilactobacillus formosensis]|uniref:beta-glucuronidase n=1 Tax=Companilactobacillus formosensis TaxID=1617889 RepID=UPI000E65B6A9|nr:beta-glucuronidase [Companilactobacillus formosensis]
MTESVLYPCDNQYRESKSLNGMWQFKFDPKNIGIAQKWNQGLSNGISMPVPGSFSDLFTKKEERDYVGDFWYETEFYIPKNWNDNQILVRFGSLTHRGTVYCNGIKITEHEGGFLPVVANISSAINGSGINKLVVKLNNELSESTLPVGTTRTLRNGNKIAMPYFDFFNYSGIQRNVWLVSVPNKSIRDFNTSIDLDDNTAFLNYKVESDNGDIRVELYQEDKEKVAISEGDEGTLVIKSPHLWNVRKAYLYTIKISLLENEFIVDQYESKIGLRTVDIKNGKICINGNPVYLKGFGKHEDFDVLGKAFNWSIVKRDFECMKWTNANCFRTSHYPYAEEWYQMADEEGFLIIDEVPAVGMMRSTQNFADAGKGKFTHFFETKTVPKLKENHIKQVQEMIKRDKNHPSVFAWSLFNEPETTSQQAYDYFKDIFEEARKCDPQNRPCTGALEKNSQPDTCKVFPLCDFICLNRYYGWYIDGGEAVDESEFEFEDEMNKWKEKKLNKPFVFTEFGTDNLVSEHKLPSIMWSQEYQNEYLKMYFDIFDKYPFIQGELVWNFADFQTSQGIRRVNGNKKGIFTRERQPKEAAFLLKNRWSLI